MKKEENKKQRERERVIFLKGKRLNLGPLGIEDVEILQKYINDPDLRIFLSARFLMTFNAEKEWVEGLQKKTDGFVFGIEDIKTGKLIGTMGLTDIDYISRTAKTGALIGNKDFQNKGYGVEAKMILLNYAFNTLNLRKIYSDVIAFNERSIKYSEKCGYKYEARFKKDSFVDGEYHDGVWLSVYKKQWQKLWEEYKKKHLKGVY